MLQIVKCLSGEFTHILKSYLQVKELLTTCGGEEYIPLFAKKQLTFKEVQYMEDKDLKQVLNSLKGMLRVHLILFQLGISSEYMRNKIRVCIDEYVGMEERMQAKLNKMENGVNGDSAPSAPSSDLDHDIPSAPDDDSPSAPAIIQTFHTPECVVCLERKVIMKPGGHWCVSLCDDCQECNESWQ